MRSALFLLALPVFLAACETWTSTTSVAGAAPISNATVAYYDVSGSTEAELRARLNAVGPVGYDGYKGDATTRWYISWHWPNNLDGSCRLAETVVSYEVKVILPRWKSPPDASPDLVAKWTKYVGALAEHEQGHVDFVVTSIPAVENAIKGSTCQAANAAGEAVLAVIRKYDVDYDAATRHGATQGARFP